MQRSRVLTFGLSGALAWGMVMGVLARAHEHAPLATFVRSLGAAGGIVAALLIVARTTRMSVWPLSVVAQCVALVLFTMALRSRGDAQRSGIDASLDTTLARIERGESAARASLIERGLREGAAPEQIAVGCAHLRDRGGSLSGPLPHAQHTCRFVSDDCDAFTDDASPAQMRLCAQRLLGAGRIQTAERLLQDAFVRGDSYAVPALIASREARRLNAPDATSFIIHTLTAPELIGLRVWGAPAALSYVPGATPEHLMLWLSGKNQPRMRSRQMPSAWHEVHVWLRLGAGAGAILQRKGERIVEVWDCTRLPQAVCSPQSDARGAWATLTLHERGGLLEFVGPLLFGGMTAEATHG